MDWYFRGECDDFIVPNDQERSEVFCEDDRPLSSDGWMQWEVSSPRNIKSPNTKHITAMETTLEEINLENSQAPRKDGILDVRPDCQLENFYQRFDDIEQMDATFLDSLLEDSPDMQHPSQPPGIFLDSECISMPIENFNSCRMGGSKHIKTSSFPLAMDDVSDDRVKKEDGQPNSRQTEGSPDVKAFIPSEQNLSNKGSSSSKEESLEAAVLQELKDVTLQMNQKTRICFRDALYRLAKSSRRQHRADKSSTGFTTEEESGFTTEEESPFISDQNEQSSSKSMESETNIFDRTIMSLLFHEMNYTI